MEFHDNEYSWGCQFNPNDEQCIDLLDKKLINPNYEHPIVTEFNIYANHPKLYMQDELRELKHFYTWFYCYSPRVKRSDNTRINRPNREAGLGHWNSHIPQTAIRNQNQIIIGYKQCFQYFEKTLKNGGKDKSTKWMMVEYSMHSNSSNHFDDLTFNKMYPSKYWRGKNKRSNKDPEVDASNMQA